MRINIDWLTKVQLSFFVSLIGTLVNFTMLINGLYDRRLLDTSESSLHSANVIDRFVVLSTQHLRIEGAYRLLFVISLYFTFTAIMFRI